MSSDAAGTDRAALWARYGAPSEQLGSVNDPRSQVEYGVRWNEKWIYHRGGEVERVILWNRYDLVGVFRIDGDGSAIGEGPSRP